MEVIKRIFVVLVLLVSLGSCISAKEKTVQRNNELDVTPTLSRVKRQFGGYYDPYGPYRSWPFPIILGGGGFGFGGRGFGRRGFGGRGFGGSGFGGRGFGGRGIGGLGFGGRGFGGFGGFGGRGGRG